MSYLVDNLIALFNKLFQSDIRNEEVIGNRQKLFYKFIFTTMTQSAKIILSL
mgnify:CR=1 FL=1|jgi:hypothetical protein